MECEVTCLEINAKIDVADHDQLVGLLPSAHLSLREHVVQELKRAGLVPDRHEF